MIGCNQLGAGDTKVCSTCSTHCEGWRWLMRWANVWSWGMSLWPRFASPPRTSSLGIVSDVVVQSEMWLMRFVALQHMQTYCCLPVG